jgi:hypothetical protein
MHSDSTNAKETRSSSSRSDRIFFSLAGLWFLVLTFVGFSPTFYLRALPEPLPTYLVLHGVVNSAWVVLFLVQALLISTNHPRWHIALGGASVFLLMLIGPVGFHVVLVKAAAGLKTADEAGFNLTGLALTCALAGAGLAKRKQPFVHKRLMLFATLVLTVAAADRVAMVFGLEGVRIFRKLLTVAPAIALVGYDLVSLRRIPVLSLSLLALVWLFIWFVITDLVFLHPSGEAIIRALTQVFVW